MPEKNSDEPLVSIAIAVYNGMPFLPQLLDSVISQTYPYFEVVITDDESTDGTQKVLDEYTKKDSRIQWSRSKYPRGMVPNFTGAVSLCKGEIIFFCDCDDVWHPNKIEEHLKAYQDPKVQWVYNNVVLVDENGGHIGFLTDYLPDYWTSARQRLLNYTWGSCVIGTATSYRASVMKGRWPADPLSQGHDSWIQMAIYPAKSHFVSEIVQDYRQHANNLTGIRQLKKKEKDQELEARAIAENMNYLKSLSRNNRLQLWKRSFFLLVFCAKKIRAFLRVLRLYS